MRLALGIIAGFFVGGFVGYLGGIYVACGLVVVSDPYHLRRAMRMAQELGLDARPSATPASRLNTSGFLLAETWRNAKYLAHHRLTANAQADELAISEH